MLLQGHSPLHHNSFIPEGGFLFLFLIYFILLFGRKGGTESLQAAVQIFTQTLKNKGVEGGYVKGWAGWRTFYTEISTPREWNHLQPIILTRCNNKLMSKALHPVRAQQVG